MAMTGFSMGVTAPSRDMLVRAATPRGSSGKVFGFVYSGLDVGSLIAPRSTAGSSTAASHARCSS